MMRRKWNAAVEIGLTGLILGAFLAGCAGGPEQKTAVAVQPDAATKAALSDIQAKVVKLDQQNQQLTTTVTQAIQRTETFGNEVKGGIASLTQNQFRVESWLAESTDHLRLRVLGFDRFAAPDLGSGIGGNVVGVGSVLSAGSDAHAGSAGGGAPAKGPILTKWRPSMLELLIAFVVGVLAASVFAALDQAVAAKVESEESNVLYAIVGFVTGLWAKIFGGKKKTAAAAPPTPPAPKS